MKAVVLLFAAAVALTALAPAEPAVAQQTSAQKKRPFVLKGGGSYPVKRQRAYSQLRKSDTIDTRKFKDPALGPRSQGQPFDNGFFFETPTGPFGGDTPYMR